MGSIRWVYAPGLHSSFAIWTLPYSVVPPGTAAARKEVGIGVGRGQCRPGGFGPEVIDHARFGREMRQGSPREAGGTHRTSVGTAPTSIARAAYRDRSRGRALEPVATSYSPARLANAGLIGGPGRKSNCCHTEQIEVKILHAQRMKISDDQRQEIWYGRKVLLMHVAAPMPRRRLQTPRIDVKLRHDLAETSLCILGMQQKGILCHVDLPPLRVELRTSGLQDRRSNQLSYKGRVSLDPAFRGRYATQSMA